MTRKKLLLLIPGVSILMIFLLFAFFPSLFTSYGLKQMDTPWLPMSAKHLLGTNDMGYDIFTELVYAAGHTITISLVSAVLSLLLGSLIGALSAVRNAAVRGAVNAVINVFVMLPKLILVLVLAAFLGRSRQMVILIITLLSWPATAKVVRAQLLHLQVRPFIRQGVLLGYSPFHNLWRHMLPNLLSVLIPRFLSSISAIMMMESTLAFLGLGDLYNPSWGTIVNFAYNRGAFLMGAYHYLLSPGLCIALVSFSLFLISCAFEARSDTAPE